MKLWSLSAFCVLVALCVELRASPNFDLQQVYSEVDSVLARHGELAFSGLTRPDSWLHSQPILISSSEQEMLRAAVHQRARALQDFWVDVTSDKKKIVEEGILLQWVIDRLQLDLGSSILVGQNLRPSFIYGPDLMQSSSGQWYFLEDQVTLVTGLDVLGLPSRAMYDEVDSLRSMVAKPKLNEFYEKFRPQFESRGSQYVGVLLRYYIPDWLSRWSESARNYKLHWDTVEERMLYLFPQLRVVEVVPYFFSQGYQTSREGRGVIEISSGDTLYFNSPGERRPISNVISALPDIHFSNRLRDALVGEWLAGRVELSHTPGVGFLDSKVIYPFVDDMIRFYLNEEPILPSLPTRSFVDASGLNFDPEAFREVSENLEQWVIKDVDPNSAGGRGVLIGPKAKKTQEAENFLQQVKNTPARFVAQKYLQPKVLRNERIFDLRVFAYAQPNQVSVSKEFTSRTNLSSGNGKINFGAGQQAARYAPVFFVNETCQQLIQ